MPSTRAPVARMIVKVKRRSGSTKKASTPPMPAAAARKRWGPLPTPTAAPAPARPVT